MFLSGGVEDLQQFIELIPSPVIVKDDSHRIVLVNDRTCKLLARPREILLTQGDDDLFSPDETRAVRAADDRVFDTGLTDECEERLTDANGGVIYVITRKQRVVINHAVYLVAVLTDVTAYRVAEAHSRHIALHDALTGLPNRILFRERVEQAALRSPGTNALLYIDLDNFKAVNDNFGHSAGDEFIQRFVAGLSEIVRVGDTIARIGGDEFAVLLTNMSETSFVAVICDRIVSGASRVFASADGDMRIGASIGVLLPGCGLVDQMEMLRRADLALYQAKGDGRGCWRVYSEALDSQI